MTLRPQHYTNPPDVGSRSPLAFATKGAESQLGLAPYPSFLHSINLTYKHF